MSLVEEAGGKHSWGASSLHFRFNRMVMDMQAREALVDEEFNILRAQVRL